MKYKKTHSKSFLPLKHVFEMELFFFTLKFSTFHLNSDWVWGRSSVQWHRLTISARTSSAGSNTWDSLLSSIFHSTLESLLSPGRSHCSSEARWLAVKFSSCVCVKNQLRDWDKQSSSPPLSSPPAGWDADSPLHMHTPPRWNYMEHQQTMVSTEPAGQSWNYRRNTR